MIKKGLKEEQEQRINCFLHVFSKYFYLMTGLFFLLTAVLSVFSALSTFGTCVYGGCNLLLSLINFVSYLIIGVAIFDVGRYLLEEEVFRDRELRSPKEARQSLTKFMVIIVIAVTLEALLNIIKAGTKDISDLVYPALLFFVAVFLLVGLGLYQKLSITAEQIVNKNKISTHE